jgi:phosphoribosylamine--glycine ligase
MRVLVVGGGAREHAIAYALRQSGATVVTVAKNQNPGLSSLSSGYHVLEPTQADAVVRVAQGSQVDYVVIGPEAPLVAGVADALRAAGIPVVGPDRRGAQIESSKYFCRDLLERHHIDAVPRHATIQKGDDVLGRLQEFPQPFVIKPDGITAGKGVWVQGPDFTTIEEGAAYVQRLFSEGSGQERIVLEEKLEGEEFSLMAFVTDSGVYPMPAVQDFKRALEGDLGPNTGGMGSYSQRDHLLPFLSVAMRDQAMGVIRQTADALKQDGIQYRGILYGGFMLTAQGPRLLEFNARFGDPEAVNVLTLYEEGNFADLLQGVALGRVDPNLLRFRLRATVVKYLVPPGYGTDPRPGGILDLDNTSIQAEGVGIRYGSIDAVAPGRVRLTTSRGVALVGEASAIWEAGVRVEAALQFVRGEYYVRHDIGSRADLTKRMEHVRHLFAPGSKPSPIPLSVAPPDAAPSSAGDATQVI